MAEKQNTPEIRFEGFTDPWEQRKLGELTSIKTGDSDLRDAAPDGRYPFFVRSDKVERSNRYLYDGEAILVPGEGRLGEIFHYVNGKFDYHQRVYKISDFNGVTAKFVMYSMMRDFKKHALQNTAKATVDSIRLPTLTEFQFSLPKPEEQKKIGQYFSQIDSLITLHQRKYDKLCTVKKSMLDKMFPKPGETEPEIRFEGFTDPWEQRKLGELTSIKTGDSDLRDAAPDGRYPFFVRSDKVERSNRYLYDGEAILVPGEGRLGEIFHYVNGKFDYHQRVYKISDFNGVTAKFVMYSMMRDFKKHALQNTAKATVDSIRLPTLTEFQFSLPKPEEQKKIGQYFSQIDSLITLHQ